MRTTLDLPERLLSEAMRVTHTKTAVIVLTLEELIRKSKISDLKKFKGKSNWVLILMKYGHDGNVGTGRHI